MSTSFDPSTPADIRLLLRADAERFWLDREVIPALRQVETPGQLPEEEVAPALAYLEAMWSEATLRARETDAALDHLCAREPAGETLAGSASRYHAEVRVLRGIVGDRVMPFVDPQLEVARNGRVRVTDARHNGCAPHAA